MSNTFQKNELLNLLLDAQQTVAGSIERRQTVTKLVDRILRSRPIGWQTVEALLGTPDVSLAFRSVNPATVKRGKTIQLKDHTLALILDLNQDNEQNIRIRVKVRSLASNTSLPEGITLRVLEEIGEPFLETQAGKADSSIETKPFQFIEQPEEKFTVKVVLGEESITENFLI